MLTRPPFLLLTPPNLHLHLYLTLQGLTCKNKRTRVVCIEEIQGAVEAAGAVALGRAGVREVLGTLLSTAKMKMNNACCRHNL